MRLLKLLRNVIGWLFVMLLIALMVSGIRTGGDKLLRMLTGHYPIAGDYWAEFSLDNNIVYMDVMYMQEIYEHEAVNMSNLELYIDADTVYKVSDDVIDSDENLRIYLLETGLARVIDEESAPKSEIRAQNKAQKKNQGLWTDTAEDKRGFHVWIGKLWEIIETNAWKILVGLIVSIFGVNKIIEIVIKYTRKKRIDVILAGEINSGKTSIIERLCNPNMGEDELRQSVGGHTHFQESKKIEKIVYDKYELYMSTYDDKGGNYAGSTDTAITSKADQKVVVYVIELSLKDGKLNEDNIKTQLAQAAVMLQIAKNSTLIHKAKTILFINKCDIVTNGSQAAFLENVGGLKNSIKNLGKDTDIEKNTDFLLLGSALKNWNIDILRDEIRKYGK